MGRSKFEPFPPHLDVAQVVESTPSFEFATRITCDAIDDSSPEDFQRLIYLNVVVLGLPLVIEGFQERLDKSLFSKDWLRETYATKVENARDLVKNTNLSLTIGHYLTKLPLLTRQMDSYTYQQPSRQRIYLKDIDCPPEWHEALRDLIPPNLFYLNRSPKTFHGPGSQMSNNVDHHTTHEGVPIAEVGDLMSCLPPDIRAENLMCYIGHEGTYTPAHQEMCASLGQNIMVDASDGSPEDGEPTRPGSSVWLMTATKDRRVVSEYWSSMLGHDIGLENHFAQLNAWRAAPSPLAAHQVWNRGTRTIKVAWNRTTVDTLKLAMLEALPHARMLCRDEQYKNKSIIYHSLEWYSELLRQASDMAHPEVVQLCRGFEKLFDLFTDVLLSESFSQTLAPEKAVEFIKFDGNVTCSYCRCNIFNRFLTCPWCCDSEGSDAYDICMDCYVLGRSCACISNLKWVEQYPWKELEEKYSKWRRQLIALDPEDKKRKSRFPVLLAARSQLGRKTTAEICQEQLALRPWSDCTKPVLSKRKAAKSEAVSESDNDRRARKRRRNVRAQGQPEQNGTCHFCSSTEPGWKMAQCTSCNTQYCYSSLFRAFDILPQVPMERPHWVCPRCRKICNCVACAGNPTIEAYQPYHVLLGHDTRKIADPRSVESLVNLRQSNRKLLERLGHTTQDRLQKRVAETAERRLRMLEEHQIDVDSVDASSSTNSPTKTHGNNGGIPVDPALELDGSMGAQPTPTEGTE
ncbi:hypothetical protein N7512_004997 [Penicillium capsulatum]|nr:hypothetical protein N7512_004997 [Penicillium capsulatum]